MTRCVKPPEDEQFFAVEREAIASTINLLHSMQQAGYDISETLTSLIANVASDQRNPMGVLRMWTEMARAKTVAILDERRGKLARPMQVVSH